METGAQPEVIDVQTAYLEADEPDDIYMYPASFSEYLDWEEHQLESLRQKLLKMTSQELKEFKKTKQLAIKRGDVDKCPTRRQYPVPAITHPVACPRLIVYVRSYRVKSISYV